MKVSISKDALLGAIQQIQSVVEKKNTVQILSNILLTAKGSGLSLSATDLEVGMKIGVDATVEREGKVTISAKHFQDIIRELQSGPLTISKKDNDWVEIISGKSRFNIVSLSADEFPTLPSFEEKTYFDANSKTLLEMIRKTGFAVSTDATRYHLNGVYFEKLENNLMRMTATDGHRLSFVDNEVFLQNPDFKRGIIIPKKGLSELEKLLDIAQDQIRISFDRGYIFANAGNTYLFVRLIEGEYPDYKQVIPKSTEKLARIPRESLMSALRRVSLLAHEKSKGVKLSLKANVLEISSSNPDMGEAVEEIEVDYGGEALEIGYNAKYLLECLPVVESETLEFRFKDRLSPGMFQGAEQKNHTYILMPMRI